MLRGLVEAAMVLSKRSSKTCIKKGATCVDCVGFDDCLTDPQISFLTRTSLKILGFDQISIECGGCTLKCAQFHQKYRLYLFNPKPATQMAAEPYGPLHRWKALDLTFAAVYGSRYFQ